MYKISKHFTPNLPNMTININTSLAIIFMLWLLILAIGYFIVEIFEWKEYSWRKHLERYNNSLFDRVLHYIIWGILANIGILFFELFFKWGQILLIELFNNSGNISSSILWSNIDRTSIQIFVFSVFYFLYLLGVICLFWCWKRIIKAVSWIGEILNKKIKTKKSKQKTNKEKSEKPLLEKEEKETKKNILIGIISWLVISTSFFIWEIITKLLEEVLWKRGWIGWVCGVIATLLSILFFTKHLLKKER